MRSERFAGAKLSHFVDISEVYRSATGAVYLGKFKYDSVTYILKERKVSELGKKKDVMNEVRLLSQLSHPNVVNCEGWFSDDDRQSLFIVLEFCPGGDLSRKIEVRRSSRRYFSEEYIWFIFHQICLGLQHLHMNGIIHRDLKTLNLLLAKEDTLVKIGDLGVSRQVSDNTSMLETFIGTPLYLSPELLDNKPYNEKTDIWSLGVILYELCALIQPFRAKNIVALSNVIRAGRYEPIPQIYSKHLEKCVSWLLNINYLKRPSINAIIEYCEKYINPTYHGEDMAAEYNLTGSARFAVINTTNTPKELGDPGVDVGSDGDDSVHSATVKVVKDLPENVVKTIESKDSKSALDVEIPKYRRTLDIAQQECDTESDDDGKSAAKPVKSRNNAGNDAKQDDSTQKSKSNGEVQIQFELSRVQMLLRRELVQFRRCLQLKDFFQSSSMAAEGSETTDRTNLEKKIAEIKERINILEECVDKKGVIGKNAILKIDALRVLVSDDSNSQENDKNSPTHREVNMSPIKYKKLHKPKSASESTAQAKEFDRFERPATAAAAKPITMLKYDNPFANAQQDMFKKRYQEYSLFAKGYDGEDIHRPKTADSGSRHREKRVSEPVPEKIRTNELHSGSTTARKFNIISGTWA